MTAECSVLDQILKFNLFSLFSSYMYLEIKLGSNTDFYLAPRNFQKLPYSTI